MHRIRPNIITIIIFLFAILTLFCHQIKRIFASVLCLFKCLRNNIFQKVFKTGCPFVCTITTHTVQTILIRFYSDIYYLNVSEVVICAEVVSSYEALCEQVWFQILVATLFSSRPPQLISQTITAIFSPPGPIT